MRSESVIATTRDANGEFCPIPLARPNRVIDGLTNGGVLEVRSTEATSLRNVSTPMSGPSCRPVAVSRPLTADSQLRSTGRPVSADS